MFALGCIIYELCMHVPPFHFEDMNMVTLTLTLTLPYTKHPFMSPSYDKPPNPNANADPASNSSMEP